MLEDHFKEDLFGVKSRLDYEEFVAVCGDNKRAAWIFNATKIRQKIFKIAEVEVRHINQESTPVEI